MKLKIKRLSYIFIKKNCIKSGKRIISKKLNIRDNKILATVTNIYVSGLYNIKVEENIGKFEEGEELIANYKDILKITEEEFTIWDINFLHTSFFERVKIHINVYFLSYGTVRVN